MRLNSLSYNIKGLRVRVSETQSTESEKPITKADGKCKKNKKKKSSFATGSSLEGTGVATDARPAA